MDEPASPPGGIKNPLTGSFGGGSWGLGSPSEPSTPPAAESWLARARRAVNAAPPLSDVWNRFTRKYRWLLLFLGVCSWGLAPLAPALLDECSNSVQLVPGSPSLKAKKATAAAFPGVVRVGTLIVLFEAPGGLEASFEEWCGWEADLAAAVEAKKPCADYASQDCFLRAAPTSWCGLTNRSLTYLAANLVDSPTPTGGVGASTAAQFLVTYDEDAPEDTVQSFVTFLSDKAKALRPSGIDATVGTTGWDAFTVASVDGERKDLSKVDSISLPLALVVMAITLGSIPLLIVPALCMLTATILEFAVVGKVAEHMQIASFVPSVMMTMTLAISFDYSLFVCSRYLEARNAGVADEATRVRAVLRGAGHTIVVSGSTLIACFLGLLCFPNAMLRGVGAAISIGLGCAMVVNLTLSPALLHAGGERLCGWQDAVERRLRALFKRPARDDGFQLLEEPPPRKANPWRFVARKVWDDRRLAVAVVALVVAVAAPACASALKVKQVADPVMIAPSPSEPQKTLGRLGAKFGAGAIAPYTALFALPPGGLNDAALDAMDDFLYGELADVGQALTVVGPTRLAGERLHAANYTSCITSSTDWCLSVKGLAATTLAASGLAAKATVSIATNPYAAEGLDWIDAARTKAKKGVVAPVVSIQLYGAAGGVKDVIDNLYASFPTVIGVTLGVVFALLCVAFGSAAVALRSICALCLTLAFTFGCAVICYQGAGADASLPAFLTTRSADPGISWLAPLLCFTIVVGLALDYDVFLLARVHEYRFHGRMGDRDATLEAVGRTGVVISAAGTIMAVAFSGLFLSHTTILNQAAFLLACGVIFDTFVVRTFVTPSLLSLSRSYAWWPAKGPAPLPLDQALARVADVDEETKDDGASEASETI